MVNVSGSQDETITTSYSTTENFSQHYRKLLTNSSTVSLTMKTVKSNKKDGSEPTMFKNQNFMDQVSGVFSYDIVRCLGGATDILSAIFIFVL